jgi:hypothetical protein
MVFWSTRELVLPGMWLHRFLAIAVYGSEWHAPSRGSSLLAAVGLLCCPGLLSFDAPGDLLFTPFLRPLCCPASRYLAAPLPGAGPSFSGC